MKKTITVLLSIMFLFLFVSCKGETNETIDIPKTTVTSIEVDSKKEEKNKKPDVNANKEVYSAEADAVEQEDFATNEVLEVEASALSIEKDTNINSHGTTKPKIVYNKELIASNSTVFDPNKANRSVNVRLAGNYINGLVLYPGEEFSFNKIVGPRTAERGFLPADIFVGQSVAQGYGGGICQTSSTVCGAVRKTNMEILEQNPHSQRVTYTTRENEAMISYGSSDFRFKDTNDYPIAIEISFEKITEGEMIKCDIYKLS